MRDNIIIDKKRDMSVPLSVSFRFLQQWDGWSPSNTSAQQDLGRQEAVSRSRIDLRKEKDEADSHIDE